MAPDDREREGDRRAPGTAGGGGAAGDDATAGDRAAEGDRSADVTPAARGAATADTAGEPADAVGAPVGGRQRRLALATAFFSFATGLSRIAGLAREIVAAKLFGVSGAMSAFTIAVQIPSLIRALFADAALQGAFVPVFTGLLEQGRRREAFHVASALFSLIVVGLGAVMLAFMAAAPLVVEVVAPGFDAALEELTVGLTRLMFPIVLLLALSGLIVGMLNSFEHFSAPALAPLAWNLVIIAALFALPPLLPPDDEIYAYAIGWVAGTVVQLVLPLPWLRGRGERLAITFDWRNPHVVRVLKLMIPVTVTLGLINFSLLINSFFGTLVSEQAPAAIDKAFRIYMLPQGLFSVAVATILFPTLSRYAARGARDDLRRTAANGVRLLALLLIPSAALMAVLAEPITRVVYERGAFGPQATELVAEALFWWAFSLPFQGVSLLFARTFFSLQRPSVTTALAAVNLAVNALVAFALYRPLGVAGIVIGTVVGTVAMAVLQGAVLRRDLGGIEGRATLAAGVRMGAAAVALVAVAYGVWTALDDLLGRGLAAQAAAVAGGAAAGVAMYAAAVLFMRVPEARQVIRLLGARAAGRGGPAG